MCINVMGFVSRCHDLFQSGGHIHPNIFQIKPPEKCCNEKTITLTILATIMKIIASEATIVITHGEIPLCLTESYTIIMHVYII